MDTTPNASEQPRRGRGRPRKSPAEKLRRQKKFRTTDALDAKLKAAARAAGRSVSEEIEHRLEMSFAQGSMAREAAACVRETLNDMLEEGVRVFAGDDQQRVFIFRRQTPANGEGK